MFGLVEMTTEFVYRESFDNFADAIKAAQEYEKLFDGYRVFVLPTEEINRIYGRG
jgi:hypothetical protein